ncbi:MAG: hypothetical protein AB3N22_06345 [Ruegeria sp.]
MSQIEELQSRITAAMERISAGVEVLSGRPALAGDADQSLSEALEEERIANAQLEERLKALKERHAEEVEALRDGSAGDAGTEALKAELEELRAQVVDPEEMERLKADLAEATAKLMAVEAARAELAEAKAVLEGSDEVPLLKAEIDTLRAQLDAAEDVEPLKVEIEELKAQLDSGEDVEMLKLEIEALRGQAAGSEDVEALRTENAALKAELADSERVAELSAELEMLRAERVSHGEAMSRLDGDLQLLRKSNDQLRETIAELRQAGEAGMADAELLNKAVQTELEAVSAARATDAAEAHAVLARLEPLLANANLAEGEVE